jgi:hypothetical protein
MHCADNKSSSETNSLAKVIAEFLDQDGRCPRDEVKTFRGLTIKDAVSKAALAVDENGELFIHQWHFFNHLNVPRQAELLLLESIGEIESCRDFDSLHEIIKSKLQISFAGELYWYDTAFRIGISMGVYPEKVYLHAGTKKGAKTLGLYQVGKKVLEISELVKQYPEFAKMKPYQIEDFLCIKEKEGVLRKFRRF